MVRQKREKTTGHEPGHPFDEAMRQKIREEWQTAKVTRGKLPPALRATIAKAIERNARKKAAN